MVKRSMCTKFQVCIVFRLARRSCTNQQPTDPQTYITSENWNILDQKQTKTNNKNKKIRISVNGLLGDNPSYRYSLDYQEEELARFWTLPWGRGLLVSENHTVYLSKLLRTQVQTVS